ncbi:hypothetical protein K6025_02745 [Ehrlichia sp. JZT12]
MLKNITIISLTVVLIILLTTLLAFFIKFNEQKGESREEVLNKLIQCINDLQLSHDIILRILINRQVILNKLCEQMELNGDQHDLSVFRNLQSSLEDLIKSFKDYIKFVKQESCVVSLKAMNYRLGYLEKLSDLEKKFNNDILPGLEETQPAVKELSQNYLKVNKQLKECTANFSKICATCNSYEKQMLDCIQRGKSVDKLLHSLKACNNELKICGSKIIEILKNKQRILENFERRIKKYNNKEATDVFYSLQKYHKACAIWWKEYIRSVEQKHDLINANVIKICANGTFDVFNNAGIEEAEMIYSKFDEILRKIIMKRGNLGLLDPGPSYDDSLIEFFSLETPSIRELYPFYIGSIPQQSNNIRGLYSAYLNNIKLLSSISSNFSTIRKDLSKYIEKIMSSHIKEQEDETTVLSVSDIVVKRNYPCCAV